MLKRTFYLQLSILLLLSSVGWAQDQFIFSDGLAVGNCHRYGRQALYTDQFAFILFSPGYKAPKPGQVLFTSDKGQDVSWKEIKADSSGIFRSRDASNGYIYITYTSAREQGAVVNISGNSMFYFNGEPHCGDANEHKWLYTPVKLRRGLNEIYIRTSRFQGITARLIFPDSPVFVNTEDATLPHIVKGHKNDSLLGAVVIINITSKPLIGLRLESDLKGKKITVDVPSIMAFTARKVAFRFNGSGIKEEGPENCGLTLLLKGKVIAGSNLKIESVSDSEPYNSTFESNIDGSVQYYAVNPRIRNDNTPSALFLSVHGAGVEALGQARAYKPKEWGVLVAPTNRRPRGFNWEDWGRLDAMEVLGIAVQEFKPDPSRIYLTGHSMGGHGTWFLGATYPGKWAAIAPCAGYPTLIGYGSADGKIPEPGGNIIERTLSRASNGSNVLELANNYGAAGVYVLHGDNDRTVSVEYARQMRQVLGTFHNDFSYYEYPGGSHWWSNESVDWPPLFDYFKWHTITPDSSLNKIDFTTSNPAVSSSYRWAAVLQQQEPLKYSRIKIDRNKSEGMFSGLTENVSVLKLNVSDMNRDTITFKIDGDVLKLGKPASGSFIYLSRNDRWTEGSEPGPEEKGTLRNGTFKEPFNHRMMFVYGTAGTKEESEWSMAKAIFDAETWYYRGNGSVDMIADKDFSPEDFPDRGIIIYGNATTNSAWSKLLTGCPIQVRRGSIMFGEEQINGDNYGAYFMYPRMDSRIASVGVVTGTGLSGLHAADANQYFTGGSGFPDFMIFSADIGRDGVKAIKHAGFYNNYWKMETPW